MQNVWYAFSALYLIALAFVSGTLAGHISLGRTAHVKPSDIMMALGGWIGLIGAGALAWVGRKRWHDKQSAVASPGSAEIDLAVTTTAVEVSEGAGIEQVPPLSSVARPRAVASAIESPIETLLNTYLERPVLEVTEPSFVQDSSIAVQPNEPAPVRVEPSPVAEPALPALPILEYGPAPIDAVGASSTNASIQAAQDEPAKMDRTAVVAPAAQSVGPPIDHFAVELAAPPAPPAPPVVADVLAVTPPPEPASVPAVPVPFTDHTPRENVQSAPAVALTAAASHRQRDKRPRTVRKGYLFAAQIIWGNARSRLIRGWLIAGATAAASAVLLFVLRDRLALPQLVILGVILLAASIGPLGQTLAATAASRRLGRTWVHLGTSPAAPASEVSGTIWVSNQRLRKAVRGRQLIRPAAVRLQCLRGQISGVPGRLDESAAWHHEVAVRPDRMTFMTRRLGIPFRFDLPEAIERVGPGEQEPLVWILSIETTMNGLEMAEQFVLPLGSPELAIRDSSAAGDDLHGFDHTPPLRRVR